MQQPPLVSCIIPVHNGARFIAQAIESVRAQQDCALDMIVVDDGSTDASADIAAGYNGTRIIRQARGGVAAARNAGLAAARGTHIAFLDADDLWLPGKLSAQLAALNASPEADYCLTLVRHVTTGPDGNLPEDEHAGEVKLGQLMQCLLAPRATFETVGGLSTETATRADQEWFLRASGLGINRVVVDQILTIRRIHGGNHSLTQADRVLDDFLLIARRNLERKRLQSISGSGGST